MEIFQPFASRWWGRSLEQGLGASRPGSLSGCLSRARSQIMKLGIKEAIHGQFLSER